MQKYFKEYKWSNIFAMLRNQKLDPEICSDDCSNRLVVITGATSGIGYATAIKYASSGADILSINRNEEKTISFLRNKSSGDSTYQEQQISNLLPQLTDLLTDPSVPDIITEKAGEILYRLFI